MSSIRKIEDQILEHTSKQDREVNGLWGVDCLYHPINNGRIFDYKFLISQTLGQGCAYSTNYNYSRELLKQYVGHDFLEFNIDDIALKVCFLDSLYGVLFPAKNKKRLTVKAESMEKLKWRTKIIIDESKRLLGNLRNKKVVNVGVVGDILCSFQNEGAIITGTDFDPSIIGMNSFGNIPVLDGRSTLDVVSDSDLAIITGMTITSSTIDDILKCCTRNNVKTIVFAETGANLADYYIKQGVNVYLSEHFPFYIFNGISTIDICYG